MKEIQRLQEKIAYLCKQLREAELAAEQEVLRERLAQINKANGFPQNTAGG